MRDLVVLCHFLIAATRSLSSLRDAVKITQCKHNFCAKCLGDYMKTTTASINDDGRRHSHHHCPVCQLRIATRAYRPSANEQKMTAAYLAMLARYNGAVAAMRQVKRSEAAKEVGGILPRKLRMLSCLHQHHPRLAGWGRTHSW